MKKNTLFFALSAIFLPFLSLKAQTKTSKDSSTTVIVFNNGNNGQPVKRIGESSIIKIAPVSFLTGRFPLVFEKRITDLFSIQIAAGLTHNNYVRNNVQEETSLGGSDMGSYKIESSTLPSNITDEADELFLFDNRKASLGYMVSLQPRVYFENEGMEGTFMGLSLDLYKYNFEIPALVKNGNSFSHSGSQKKEGENIRDLMVSFGNQHFYDRLTLEYFGGLGIRAVKGTKYAAGADTSNNLIEGEIKYSQNILNFSCGIKVGYRF